MKTVTVEIRPLAWAAVAALLLLSVAGGYLAGAKTRIATGGAGEIDAYIADHPEAIEKLFGDYLRTHPETLTEMVASLLKKGKDESVAAVPQIGSASAIASNAPALFSSPRQVTLGNPQGDVTVVEFFDYNCGYCKRALPDTLALLKSDPKLKIVLKELPILGQDSVDVARVAVAVRMQDASGKKYLAFHRKLLGGREPASDARAREIARSLGLDMKRLETDMASKEATDTLDESSRLASALNIGGTPSYVVGHDVLAGAIGIDALSDRIRIARQ